MFKPIMSDSSHQEWVFSADGKPRANLVVRDNCFLIRYTLNGQGVHAWIDFAWTFPFCGGRRLWFVCPSCGRRCGVVYLAKKVACRKCHSLLYPCQMETGGSKGLALLQRWRLKVNEGGEKPRYMHSDKYYAYKDRIDERETASLLQLFGGIRGLKRLLQKG